MKLIIMYKSSPLCVIQVCKRSSGGVCLGGVTKHVKAFKLKLT